MLLVHHVTAGNNVFLIIISLLPSAASPFLVFGSCASGLKPVNGLENISFPVKIFWIFSTPLPFTLLSTSCLLTSPWTLWHKFRSASRPRQRLSRPFLFPGCTSIRGVQGRVQKVLDHNPYSVKDNPFPISYIWHSPPANVVVSRPEKRQSHHVRCPGWHSKQSCMNGRSRFC